MDIDQLYVRCYIFDSHQMQIYQLLDLPVLGTRIR